MSFDIVLIESIVLGLTVGVILAIFGAGGSLLATPTLVFLFGFSVPTATLTTLIIVGTSSLIGAISRLRHGEVNFKLGAQISAYGFPGTLLGATLTKFIPDWVTLCLLVMMMFYAGVSILRGPVENIHSNKEQSRFLVPVISSAIGFLTGLLGIGGGILLVPALVIFLSTPTSIAIGTSLVSISMTAMFALILRSGELPGLPISQVSIITLTSSVAVLACSRLARAIKGSSLNKAFAIFLVAVGVLSYLATVFSW